MPSTSAGEHNYACFDPLYQHPDHRSDIFEEDSFSVPSTTTAERSPPLPRSARARYFPWQQDEASMDNPHTGTATSDFDEQEPLVNSLDAIRSNFEEHDYPESLSATGSNVNSPHYWRLAATESPSGECLLGGILGVLSRMFSRSINNLTEQKTYSGDPNDLLERTMMCPISHEIMVDPVVDPDGHSYEREAILEWLSRDSRSPITRKPISRDELRPNRALQAVIHQYIIQMEGVVGLEEHTA